MTRGSDRGAVAVEMALVLPVLVLLLLGIMEFGRAYNAQITLTNAAREGVRVMAITGDKDDAIAAAKEAASGLMTTAANPTFAFKFRDPDGSARTACASEHRVILEISYKLDTITGLAGPFNLAGKGAMLCGG